MEQEKSAESKDGFGSEARKRVSDSYSAHTASMDGLGEKSEPSLPESVQEDAPTGTPPAEGVTDASPAVEAKEGFEPEQAPSGEAEEKSGDKAKEDDRTVSYDAFHEERERRKEFQAKVTTLEEQQAVLLKDLHERDELEKLREGTDTDAETEIIRLKREVEELKSKDSKRDADSEVVAAEEMQRKLKESISSTDKSLSDEGFPGFAFAQASVAAAINELVADDPDNAFMLNDPNSWKRIYKEKVYPGLKAAFTTKERAEKNAEKEALKDEAALAGNAGKPDAPTPKKVEKEHTYADYLKMRQKSAPT